MSRKRKTVDAHHADELLSAGKTLNEVANLFGIHPDSLSKKLRAVGVRTNRMVGRRGGGTRLNVDMGPIIEAYVGGESLLSISKRTGIERIVLTPRLREAGVPVRGGTAANLLRMARMTREERLALTAAAHDAVRGATRSEDELVRRALSKPRRIGAGEAELVAALAAAGEDAEGQRPCDKYNIDVAFGTVAVEVCGSGGTGRLVDRRFLKRAKVIADAGHTVVFVLFNRTAALIGNLEHVVRELQLANGDPPSAGKHRVIRCRMNDLTGRRNELGQYAGIGAPPGFRYAVSELEL